MFALQLISFFLPLSPSTEWQSAFLVYLRHHRVWFILILCTANGDGDTSIGYTGRCDFCARLLSSANGRVIRHQCALDTAVSSRMNVAIQTLYKFLISFIFAEELLASYLQPYAFYGVRRPHRSSSSLLTRWIISKF